MTAIQTEPCDGCAGTGQVPAGSQEHARRMRAEGERRRLDRVNRRVHLGEEARRLGITPLELSLMERGRMPWPEEASDDPPWLQYEKARAVDAYVNRYGQEPEDE